MIANNIKIFLAVVERGSITEAANDLYITQPAVSRAIKSLEEKLNVKLFHRDKRNGLILTSVGEKILLLARHLLELENHIYQTAFQENNFIGGKLKIASFPIVTSTIVSKALRLYRQRYPYVTVELVDREPQEVLELVEAHAVDLGIGCSPFGALEHETLVNDRMVAVFPQDGPHYEKVNLYEDTRNLIFCEAGRKTTIETMESGKRIHFHDSLIVKNHETIISMVEQHNGIGIIAEFTLNAIPNDLLRCPVYPLIEMEIGLVTTSFQDLTPVAAAFVQVVKETLSAEAYYSKSDEPSRL